MVCPNCGRPVAEGAVACPACGTTLLAGAGGPAVMAAPASLAAAAAVVGVAGYAGFWRRFVAALVDWFILYVAMLPLQLILPLQIFTFRNHGEDFDLARLIGVATAAACIRFVVVWLYFALMESSARQATLGKIAIGIVVTDDRGRRISFARATGRFFGKLLSNLTFLIGYLLAAFTEKKQALHDLIAGTLVVRKAGV